MLLKKYSKLLFCLITFFGAYIKDTKTAAATDIPARYEQFNEDLIALRARHSQDDTAYGLFEELNNMDHSENNELFVNSGLPINDARGFIIGFLFNTNFERHDANGNTAFHIAIMSNNNKTLLFLLSTMLAKYKYNLDNNPGNAEIAEQISQKISDIFNKPNNNGDTLLECARRYNNTKALQLLSDLEATDYNINDMISQLIMSLNIPE